MKPKQVRKKHIPMKLHTMISLLITLLIIIAVSGTVVLSFQVYRENMIEQVASSRADVLMQISAKVESLQKNMIALSSVYCDIASTVVENEHDPSNAVTADEWMRRVKASDEYYRNAMGRINVDYYATLIGADGLHYISDQESENYDFSLNQRQLWYIRIPTTIDPEGLFWTQSHKDSQIGDGFYFSLAKRVADTQNESMAVIISIPERTLWETYKNIVENNAIYIVNSSGRIISHSNERMVDLNYFNMPRMDQLISSGGHIIVQKSGVEYLLSRFDNSEYGLVFIEEIPLADLLVFFNEMQKLITLMALGMIGISILIMIVVVRNITSPLYRVCRKLEAVSEGAFDTDFDVTGCVEICLINDVSKEMTYKISSLIGDIKEKERQKRLAEIEFLQAQINPHFMYNTLFSIKCLIGMGEEETAEKMLDSFSAMLRTVLESKQEIITLAQERTSLQRYFEVLQYRYGDGIQLIFELPAEMNEDKVLKFILQPIVENSIFHGLEPKGGTGTIRITAQEEADCLLLKVDDDGVGFDETTLQKVREKIENGQNEHVGISNVLKRIRLNFGEEYGLTIDSKDGQGTSVTIVLPRLGRQQNEG